MRRKGALAATISRILLKSRTPRADVVAQPAPAPIAAPAVEAPSQERACPECDAAISAVPGAEDLSREDMEMTKLACRSSAGSSAEAYRACVTEQIGRLEDALPMRFFAMCDGSSLLAVARLCEERAERIWDADEMDPTVEEREL